MIWCAYYFAIAFFFMGFFCAMIPCKDLNNTDASVILLMGLFWPLSFMIALGCGAAKLFGVFKK